MTFNRKDIILQITDVNISYIDENDPRKEKQILKDINLTEYNITRDGTNATGQTIAILGASGRGKSTFFRALVGLLDPEKTKYSGSIKIIDPHALSSGEAKISTSGDIGFVDQKYTLFRHKKVIDIFRYALRKSNQLKANKEAVIDEYLCEWGLKEHYDKYPCELSGGQRQRVAIIEQMLTSKIFMVLDEPFSGLDVRNIKKVSESFNKILSSHEYNTIIFSTHDIGLAVEMADSIYVIGLLNPSDTSSTILKHYDLKELGLAWTDYGPKHDELRMEIRTLIENS
jgi:ABC-type nitrate/sulfonate/bicarbonate transport system ATPase subunit